MIKINYSPRFSREFWKLDESLRREAVGAIKLFCDSKNHRHLKVHKLHGGLKNRHSFSVNYQYRIVFNFVSKTEVDFLTIGDHDIYK